MFLLQSPANKNIEFLYEMDKLIFSMSSLHLQIYLCILYLYDLFGGP